MKILSTFQNFSDMGSLRQEVVNRIGALAPGSILFPTDFRGIGTDDAINGCLKMVIS